MADVLLQKRTPTVLWAQRRDRLFLTIEVPCAGQAPKVTPLGLPVRFEVPGSG